ncbi:hypothetical protein AB0M45_18080 [Nocardia sp. NPDC051787]|uniref:hypothetical protein n=1 Tax=Nocardia sp. NPDC051787 TaxID=3155415 RepID=UPI00343A0F43
MSDALSNGSSEIAALAQQVETARGKLPLQYDPALLEVLSEREIAAERELAEWIRAQRRQQRRREIEAELAAEQRDRKSSAALRRADEADARWHRRALAARRRVSSEDARLAQLYRRAEWSSRALIAVVVLGMVWAGVNVQHNLVPSGDMSDPLYWLSYGIEAMISIPIITIMVAATTAARWGRELARGKVIFFEAALLGTTVALNTGPHLAAGDLGRAAEYAIAPVMVGVVIWLHAWVSARYAVLIDGAPVVDRDTPMVRIDAEPVSGRSDYHPLDNRDDPANGGRFRWEAGSDAPRLNGHTVPPRSNGRAFPHATNGHAVETSANGRAHNLVDGHPTATTTGRTADTGNADTYPDDEVRDISAASGRSDGPSTNGYPVTAPNGRVFPQATNGHRVETSSHGYAHDIPVNGHPTPPSTTSNGHNVPPDRPTAASNGSAAPSVVAGHSATPLPEDRPASSIVPPANARTTQSADDPAVLPYSADAEDSSPAVESSSANMVNHPEASIAGTLEPHREAAKQPAARQISMEDLHGDFVLRSGAPSNEATANTPVAQQLSSSEPGGRPIERRYGGFDSTGRPSIGTTEPTRTPTAATADAAAQANPKATAPRGAKRGKSLSAEHGDRSSDAESEQLALDESPEPVRPHLRAEPMPILDEDDEDDEFSTETDEADTDDDEISAIARAITGRRLSSLPIEEVREILTLADQGGATPAIANELGVSRAAVTRVLDSAIRVHRPYLVIG